MKIQYKNKKALKLVAVALLACSLLACLISLNTKPSINSTPDLITPSTIIDEQKKDDNTSQEGTDVPTSSIVQNSIDITATSIDQDTPGGPIVIRTILNSGDVGKCSYALTRGTVTKSYSSDTSFSGTYYSCNYDIPYADISDGDWTATITANFGNKSGTISKLVKVSS